jgi:hypothetical protein
MEKAAKSCGVGLIDGTDLRALFDLRARLIRDQPLDRMDIARRLGAVLKSAKHLMR